MCDCMRFTQAYRSDLQYAFQNVFFAYGRHELTKLSYLKY